MKVGKKLRDAGESLFFAISDVGEMGRELEECGISDKSGAKPVVCAFDKKNKKFKMTDAFRYMILASFKVSAFQLKNLSLLKIWLCLNLLFVSL